MVNWEQVINELELPELPAGPDSYTTIWTSSGEPQRVAIPTCGCGATTWTVGRPSDLLRSVADLACTGCGRVVELRYGLGDSRGQAYRLGDCISLPFSPPTLDNDIL